MKNSSLFISWTDLCTPPPSHKTIQISFELLYQKIFSTNVQNLYYNKFQLKGREDVWKKVWAMSRERGLPLYTPFISQSLWYGQPKRNVGTITATYLTRELYRYIYLVKESKVFNSMSNIITILKMEHNVWYC